MNTDAALTVIDAPLSYNEDPMQSYEWILNKFNIPFSNDGKFLKINNMPHSGGWVLYVSVVFTEVEFLLHRILPYLVSKDLSFYIAKSPEIVRALSAGFYGYQLTGKVVSIYPGPDILVSELAAHLIELTTGLMGPVLPTAFHLKGVVHTNYSGELEDNGGNTGLNIKHHSNGGSLFVAQQLAWPFTSITPPPIIKEPRILAKKYIIDKVIKADAKGNVFRVFDIKKIRYRVVKEGKKYMSYDFAGRDIRDRLRWQFELHNKLQQIIPIPKAIELFEESGNYYLVVNFEKGVPFSQFIDEIYNLNHYSALPLDSKKKLLSALKSVLLLLNKLHMHGYIFRDVNPRNFLITRHRVSCIDFELSYDLNTGEPNPPFELGTPGYMSPEQNNGAIPSVMQDIYGVGGMLVRCLTGLSPMVFNLSDISALRIQLSFHLGQEESNLISRCFSDLPEERPSLLKILNDIDIWHINISSSTPCQNIKPQPELIHSTIQRGITALSTKNLTTKNKLWLSRSFDELNSSNDESIETKIYLGLHEGIGGVLYLLLQAQMVGFDISPLKGILEPNLTYTFDHFIYDHNSIPAGLFHGIEGLGLLANRAINQEWIIAIPEMQNAIQRSIERSSPALNLSHGAAGIGITLLEFCKNSNWHWANAGLDVVVDKIIRLQRKDGSWLSYDYFGSPLKDIDIGLYTGMSGIIYFLFKVFQYNRSARALSCGIKGLNYFLKNERMYKSWNRTPWIGNGSAGISISLLQGFSISTDVRYRIQAEKILRKIPANLNSTHLNVSNGMAGVGEVYLHASAVLNSDEWMNRAEWITNYLLHRTIETPEGGVMWATDTSGIYTADLMTGSSGILHYLLRYQNPSKIDYPIF